jgi:hypothetical protein
MSKIVLEIGRTQRPYGTGVVRGWQGIERHHKLGEPRDTDYICETCEAPIKLVPSFAPFTSMLWICTKKHKFSYVNTD